MSEEFKNDWFALTEINKALEAENEKLRARNAELEAVVTDPELRIMVMDLKAANHKLKAENKSLTDNAHWLTCVKGDLELKLQHAEEDITTLKACNEKLEAVVEAARYVFDNAHLKTYTEYTTSESALSKLEHALATLDEVEG